MTTTLLTSDHETQQSVQDELLWTPDVTDANIGVAVDNGTVRLSGEVDNYSQRLAARKAAQRTFGVTTVIADIVIHPSSTVWNVTETDIAKSVQSALSYAILPDSVRASVENHTVVLTGEVEWNYQRDSARLAVENITGVALVINDITLRPRPSAAVTETGIRQALIRNATVDAGRLHVNVSETTVTLTGQVRSSLERDQAESAAWSSPHVTHVKNDISITP